MEIGAFSPEAGPYLLQYREALPQRLEIGMIARAMDAQELRNRTALDVGMPNPAMSLLLRQRGGAWAALACDEALAQQTGDLLGEPVAVLPDADVLPYEDHVFDWVVLALGVLTARGDPQAFIQECHRVLKPAGRLILSTRHLKTFSIVNWLCRDLRDGLPGPARKPPGYTERELFQLLKTGFDVMAVTTYCKLLVELVRIWEARALHAGGDPSRVRRRAALAYAVAGQFDYLGRGHVLAAVCRRRQWRPRTLPVLSDGRSIHEAVLHRMGP